ncbi:Pre-mRNA splicing factor [Musa troglodytarum]|uniref:Pre-mRNA splicing factor n=1 Tax=Musa troglodytarum TaxID=320322 RepID=A0A9E7HTT9_9LILI|nr:Pre-mRNA splicing factor [Musa troglodytarum]
MALKFLNKKGWHTGSLRNIENVWKAEQKHEAEQRKLEELRKQIQDEREKSEFRLLQEQAGLVPRQERLDFLYESGLAVGKGGSDGFKALQAPPAAASTTSTSEASSSKAAVPGALFEDKPQSANDAWRKLHSDPLLLIRQREQEALARIKNNPIKMAMIKKSVEDEEKKKQDKKEKKRHKDHHGRRSSRHYSDSEYTSDNQEEKTRERRTSAQQEGRSKRRKHSSRDHSDSEDVKGGAEEKRKSYQHRSSKHDEHSLKDSRREGEGKYRHSILLERQQHIHSKNEKHSSRGLSYSRCTHEEDGTRPNDSASEQRHADSEIGMEDKNRDSSRQREQQPGYNHCRRRRGVPKMSEEERAARLREMQLDAEVHEEQRLKRLKRATEADAREATRASSARGKNFLDAAQKSIYGAEKGGSATIEESVRRRAYYSQGSSAAHESNAFRR